MVTRAPETELERVDALLERGRWYAARKAIRQTLQNHPSDIDARAQGIQIEAVLAPMVEARARLQAAALELVEEAPNHVFPRIVHAAVAHLRGFRRLALEWMLQMESWFPQDRRVTRYTASLLAGAGRFSEAWSRYRSLLQAGAHFPPAHRTNAFVTAWEVGDKAGAREVRKGGSRLQRVVLWPPWVHLTVAALPEVLTAAALVTKNDVLLATAAALFAVTGVLVQIRCPDLRITSVLRNLLGFVLPLVVLLVWEEPASYRWMLAGLIVVTFATAVVIRLRLQKRRWSSERAAS